MVAAAAALAALSRVKRGWHPRPRWSEGAMGCCSRVSLFLPAVLTVTTASKSVVKLAVDKGAAELLAEAADVLDAWCRANAADYRQLKSKGLGALRRRSQTIEKRKSFLGSPSSGASSTRSSSGTVSSSTGGGGTWGKSWRLSDADSLDLESSDTSSAPDNVERMKAAFLQFRRMELKTQIASSDLGAVAALETELARLELDKAKVGRGRGRESRVLFFFVPSHSTVGSFAPRWMPTRSPWRSASAPTLLTARHCTPP